MTTTPAYDPEQYRLEREARQASRAKYQIAVDAFEAAQAKFRRVRTPEAKAAAALMVRAASTRETCALIVKIEEERDVLRKHDDERLIKMLTSARASSYEAQMGDYSIGSITAAAQHVKDLVQVLAERGIDGDVAAPRR